MSGGEAAAVPGASLQERETLAQWSADGRFLYIARWEPPPAALDRLELSTGRNEPWKRLAPADLTGVDLINRVRVSRDGLSHVYSYRRVTESNLHIVEGIQ